MSVEGTDRAATYRALADAHRLAVVDVLAVSDATPGELCAVVGISTNLLAHHLRVLEEAGVVERRCSEGDARRRYVRLRPEAFARLLPPALTQPPRLPLFVCTQNSARSQFAEALWRKLSGRVGLSAGSRPAPRVHPLAVEVAASHGIDLSGCLPKGYADIEQRPDLVVSFCDRATEGELPFAAPRIHWSVPDPARGGREDFELAFDDIAGRLRSLTSPAAAGRTGPG